MASIQRIVSPLTKDIAYRAQVRVKGRAAQSATFQSNPMQSLTPEELAHRSDIKYARTPITDRQLRNSIAAMDVMAENRRERAMTLWTTDVRLLRVSSGGQLPPTLSTLQPALRGFAWPIPRRRSRDNCS